MINAERLVLFGGLNKPCEADVSENGLNKTQINGMHRVVTSFGM